MGVVHLRICLGLVLFIFSFASMAGQQILIKSILSEKLDLSKKERIELAVEVDDDGEAITRTEEEIAMRDLTSYSKSRAGRTIYQYKDVIFDTLKQWVTAGSTKLLGVLGLAIGRSLFKECS